MRAVHYLDAVCGCIRFNSDPRHVERQLAAAPENLHGSRIAEPSLGYADNRNAPWQMLEEVLAKGWLFVGAPVAVDYDHR